MRCSAGQLIEVHSGGLVLFCFFAPAVRAATASTPQPSPREGCLVVKFHANRLATQSEQFANELTRHLGVPAPVCRMLRKGVRRGRYHICAVCLGCARLFWGGERRGVEKCTCMLRKGVSRQVPHLRQRGVRSYGPGGGSRGHEALWAHVCRMCCAKGCVVAHTSWPVTRMHAVAGSKLLCMPCTSSRPGLCSQRAEV